MRALLVWIDNGHYIPNLLKLALARFEAQLSIAF